VTARRLYREKYYAADIPAGRTLRRLLPPNRRHSMGIVIAMPPMTSFNLKSRLGLSG